MSLDFNLLHTEGLGLWGWDNRKNEGFFKRRESEEECEQSCPPTVPQTLLCLLDVSHVVMPSPFTAFADAPKVLPGLGVKVEGIRAAGPANQAAVTSPGGLSSFVGPQTTL